MKYIPLEVWEIEAMTFDKGSRIGIIGSGFVGGSLAVALSRVGYSVVAAASRRFASAESLALRIKGCKAFPDSQDVIDVSDVVFLTTPDDLIKSISERLTWRSKQAAIHCSGAASLDVLDHLLEHNVIPGAFHPLQAFMSVDEGADSLSGITIGIEGGEDIAPFLEEMAKVLGAHPVFLSAEDKALYHMSGVMLGGLLTEYAAITTQLWEHIGRSRSDGIRALLPMMRQVANNLERFGLPEAVAGPYARGDVGTIRKHLDALQERKPELLAFYCELALAGMGSVEEKQVLDETTRIEIINVLKDGLLVARNMEATEEGKEE